jgi:hypothetical protein
MNFYLVITKLFDSVLKIFSFIAIMTVLLIWYFKRPCAIRLLTFFLEFQGTVFLASAFSASIGELSANCNENIFKNNLKKFYCNCKQSKGCIGFNPLLFFSGIIFLLVATILSAIS